MRKLVSAQSKGVIAGPKRDHYPVLAHGMQPFSNSGKIQAEGTLCLIDGMIHPPIMGGKSSDMTSVRECGPDARREPRRQPALRKRNRSFFRGEQVLKSRGNKRSWSSQIIASIEKTAPQSGVEAIAKAKSQSQAQKREREREDALRPPIGAAAAGLHVQWWPSSSSRRYY